MVADDPPRKIFFPLAVLLGLTTGFLSAEVLLAVLAPVPYALEWDFYYVDDPHTGYRIKPGSRSFFPDGIPANANSMGNRDDEVSVPKPAETFRILLLGDSFTTGVLVREEETYGQVLEAELSGRNPRIEVVNSGVGGWAPFQYAQYLDAYGLSFDPDLILVGFFVGNDSDVQHLRVEHTSTAILGRRVSRKENSRQVSILGTRMKILAYERLHLARLFWNTGAMTMDFDRVDCRDFRPKFLSIQRGPSGYTRNHVPPTPERISQMKIPLQMLKRIRESGRRRSTPVVVLLIPNEAQVNPHLREALGITGGNERYDFDEPQKYLTAQLETLDIPVIDLLLDFREDPRCLYRNDTHWDPAGHQFAAERLAVKLAPFLPPHVE